MTDKERELHIMRVRLSVVVRKYVVAKDFIGDVSAAADNAAENAGSVHCLDADVPARPMTDEEWAAFPK